MAEAGDNEDRTEEATEERRQQFRDDGMIPMSREAVSALVLFGVAGVFVSQTTEGLRVIAGMLIRHFNAIATVNLTPSTVVEVLAKTGWDLLLVVLPVAGAAALVGTAATFLQTRFAFSWKRVSPKFEKLDPLQGLKRMVGMDSWMEVLKGIAKLVTIGVVAWLILHSEFRRIPSMMGMPTSEAWGYWGKITLQLTFTVAATLLAIGAMDYLYHFITIERKMRMTKEEVKQEFKNRELNPQLKGRQKAMARQIAMNKATKRTKEATVVITNPTHFAVALKFDFTMRAPIVVAKGKDLIAARIREIAKENEIPIVENKPLAQSLFKLAEIGQEIPAELFKAVSEIILYVFKLKNIRIPRKARGA